MAMEAIFAIGCMSRTTPTRFCWFWNRACWDAAITSVVKTNAPTLNWSKRCAVFWTDCARDAGLCQPHYLCHRPAGHDARYAIDQPHSQLGWRPSVTVEEGLGTCNGIWTTKLVAPLLIRKGVGERLGKRCDLVFGKSGQVATELGSLISPVWVAMIRSGNPEKCCAAILRLKPSAVINGRLPAVDLAKPRWKSHTINTDAQKKLQCCAAWTFRLSYLDRLCL